MTRPIILMLVVLAVSGAAVRQSPAARAAADAVVIDVSVAEAGQPVEGLTAADFELRDNGVLQRVDDVTLQTRALDVSTILDVSGSVTGAFEDDLIEGAKDIQRALHSDDRAEAITVGRTVRRTTDFGDWMAEAPPRIGDGGTRLFDAILTTTLERGGPDRRHVIVALTDGLDTGSVIDRATRVAVLGRSDAVVHLVAISLGERRSGTQVFRPEANSGRAQEGDYDYLLREITDTTGGTFYDIRPGGSFVDALGGELSRLRRSYTLRYHPGGVSRPGWHTLAIRLTRSHHDLHARSGYFGK